MAERKVIKDRAKLFPHPNSERLELCKVGSFQLVVRKGQYQDGDPIVIAPERAILPPHFACLFVSADTGASYLHGPDKNRVGSVRLRKELSQGVILPLEGLEDAPFGVDLSERLGITFWEPPIPANMSGEVAAMPAMPYFCHHDVEQPGIYAEEFTEGEEIIVTEKVHGTQGVYFREGGEWWVSSKGLARRQLGLKKSEGNLYWQAAHNTGLFEAADAAFSNGAVQVFAEVVPAQKGFGYGMKQPTTLIIKLVVNGETLPRAEWPQWFESHGVPVLYQGPLDWEKVQALRGGKETVSGQALHIREGVVLTPAQPRLASDGQALSIKLISDAYAKKETGEELS